MSVAGPSVVPMSENTAASEPAPQPGAVHPRAVLDVVAVDCPDARALAGFYAGILGWEVTEDSEDDWVTIVPPGAGEGAQSLAFQQIDDYVAPTWPGGAHPQQFHLDLRVPDLTTGEALVLASGATRHDHQPSPDDFVVYLDPAGHPFCLVT
jgi:catechol 2,3-dioxygenase-like lactoylglutathione lyase family enzyme